MNLRPGQRLDYCELSREVLFKPTPYRVPTEFKPDVSRFKRWWTAKLWALLVRYGALEPYLEKVITWRYTEADQQKLRDLVCRAADHMGFNGSDLRDYVLVVGAKDFQELMACPAIRRELWVDVDGLRSPPFYTFMSIRVLVAPYVTGHAFIRKEVVLIHQKEERNGRAVGKAHA